MSTKTSNFEYTKPGEDEFYDVTEYNQTLDKIDADMKALKDIEENHTDNTTVHVTAKDKESWNTALENKTLTYTESSTIQDLNSGEKLSLAFGKLKKAVNAVKNHIGIKATTSVQGHVKLSNSSAVTGSTGLALPATEKNASIEGSLANQIAGIKGFDLVWSNDGSNFNATDSYNGGQVIGVPEKYDAFIIMSTDGTLTSILNIVDVSSHITTVLNVDKTIYSLFWAQRKISIVYSPAPTGQEGGSSRGIFFDPCYYRPYFAEGQFTLSNACCVPFRIYGVKR